MRNGTKSFVLAEHIEDNRAIIILMQLQNYEFYIIYLMHNEPRVKV